MTSGVVWKRERKYDYNVYDRHKSTTVYFIVRSDKIERSPLV